MSYELAKYPHMLMQLKNLSRLSIEQREAITSHANLHRLKIKNLQAWRFMGLNLSCWIEEFNPAPDNP